MKTFGTCSICNNKHSWREIDYDNMLYLSNDDAIRLTLCDECVKKYTDDCQNKNLTTNYKHKIDSILKGKTKPVLDFVLINQNYQPTFWNLSF